MIRCSRTVQLAFVSEIDPRCWLKLDIELPRDACDMRHDYCIELTLDVDLASRLVAACLPAPETLAASPVITAALGVMPPAASFLPPEKALSL